MNEDQPYFPQAVTLEEAWVRARNTWTLAQRHGTLEEGDLMAVGELRRHVKLIDEGGVPLDVVNKAINAAVADASNGARQTAEYWKAEHLAGNDRIAMLETSNAHFTERIIELEADLAAAQAERDALFRSKSTLNTRVLAAEAEVQALRVAHEAALAEAVGRA